MGVNSISSTTVDGRGLQEASKKQPQEERIDGEFRNFVTERRIARPEGPAEQQQGATATERDPHKVTPRETLLAIARGYHTSAPTFLSGNPKFPGRTDHGAGALANKKPAPGATPDVALSASVSLRRAEAADAAFQKAKGSSNAAELRQRSEVAWSAFRLSIAAQLKQAGKGHLFPDEASQSAIKRIKHKYGHANAKATEQIDEAAAQVDAFWQHLGLTGSQFDKIVHFAQAASRAVGHSSQKVRGEGAAQTEQREMRLRMTARESWDRVGAAIESKLGQSAADKIYPEDAVKRDIGELKTRLPDRDVNFNAAASAARSRIEAQWRREGRTYDTFGVIMRLAHNMRVAERTRDQARIAQAQGALRIEIEKQLKSATGSVPTSSSELAGLVRAAALAQRGPQDPLFHEALEQAYGGVFVEPRAEAVERAYGAQHDVLAAVRELASQTHNVLAPLANTTESEN
jgi:hypothetical protein